MGGLGTYVRVREGAALPLWSTVDAARSLIFVDVDGERPGGWESAVAEQLRFVDESALSRSNSILLRAPRRAQPEGLDLISSSVEQRTGRKPNIGEVMAAIGNPTIELVWHNDSQDPASSSETLAAAREIELAALLANGNAHWRPRTFHFELPSGQHRSDFIRVGDAFKHPRDAEALATWFYPYVDAGRAVLLDTSTIMPIALALRSASSLAGLPLGPIGVRDDYPDSILRDEQLIEFAVGANGALVILSVSSTGRTTDALALALQRQRVEWWLEVLVDRATAAADGLREVVAGSPRTGRHAPWLQIPEDNPPSHLEREDDCWLCHRSVGAAFVRIDPNNFSNTMLPEPAIIAMPDPPKVDRDIDLLLEMYDRVDGVGVDCEPAPRTRLRRTPRRWGIRFYPHRLLADERFLQAAAQQISRPTKDWRDGRSDIEKLRGFDTIVFLEDDRQGNEEGFDKFCDLLVQMLGDPRAEPKRVSLTGSSEAEADLALAAKVASSQHILIVSVGTVSGGTLQELLVRVGKARTHGPSAPFAVSGLVVHARPPSFREWQAARSAFYQRLVSLWITYFPDDHPLADEQRLYRHVVNDDALSVEARSYVAGRRRWVLQSPQSDWRTRQATWDSNAGDPNPAAVLLCSAPERPSDELPRLLPNSRFGDRMSLVGTLAGVGTTLHRSRLEAADGAGPVGLRFDLTRIPVVYFETPIISSVLRWLRPSEVFWEYTGRRAEDVLREMWYRAEFEAAGNQEMLLAELLLAAASGRLPRHTEPILRQFAEDLQARTDAHEFAPIEVGLQLLGEAWPAQD